MTGRSEQLISLYLQDPSAMTAQQARELSDWIAEDETHTKAFIEASLFHRSVHDILLRSDEARNSILRDADQASGQSSDSFFDAQLWDMLSKEEATAPKVEIESSQVVGRELIQHVQYEKTAHRIKKSTFLIPLFSMAAMLILILYVIFVPNVDKVEVATLTDSLDAQWAESSVSTRKDARLMTNHSPLMLRKGYAELVFDNNTKVVIEAPAEFQVISYDQIKLTYGRLYATVPQEALGFIVSTPTTKIIDLGTEFGVQADINGTTELHVVKGKTTLMSGEGENKSNTLVCAGAAKRVTGTSAKSVAIDCRRSQFVRTIDSGKHFIWRGQPIDLADIVAGGNGFGTGKPDAGVEPSTGQVISKLSTLEMYDGEEGYRPVKSIPYIDGVFVPGISTSANRIASNGIETNEFPHTSGKVWGYIASGAWHHGFDVPRHALKFNGLAFDGTQDPAITMHSNLGITFDLAAIRQALPQVNITSFKSQFGVSSTVNQWLKDRNFNDFDGSSDIDKIRRTGHSTVELWVFLDGQKTYRKMFSSGSDAAEVNIPIGSNVRFLTLAVTEADDTYVFDWAFLAHPELILEFTDVP